jgi:hypothetical protein
MPGMTKIFPGLKAFANAIPDGHVIVYDPQLFYDLQEGFRHAR